MTVELTRDLPIPPGLEDRTVAALRSSGLLGSSPVPPVWGWLRLAASIALFAAGAVAGAAWSAPADDAAPGQPRFLLLLQGGPSLDAAEEAQTAERYRAWAGGLAREGRFINGERLAAQAIAVPGVTVPGADEVQGFFIVSAVDLADAVSVAQSSPHVARGGRVIVRPIDTP